MAGRIALIAATGIVAIAFAACAAPVVSPSTGTPSVPVTAEPSLTPPPGGPTGSVPASAGPAVSPAGLSGAALSCGTGDPGFAGSVLDQPANAELAPDAPTDALRRYLRTADVVAQGWPAGGWRLVDRSASRVTWIAPGTDGWWIATFEPDGSDWSFSEGGACHLQIDLPDGAGFASWVLDPANPPTPEATTIHVLGTELACANGKPPVGRVLAPIVLPTDQAVTIALVVRSVPGGADCPGNPTFPQDVTLTAPLGGRPLFDGSTIPPTPRS
jgi:hypothetical protein